MVSRKESNKRRQRHKNAMARYEKEKLRNRLATPGVNNFIIVLDHLKAGFNVPKIFRSAEAFGASEVHLVNIPPFDPSPAKGAFRKVPTIHHANFANCHADLLQKGYTLYTLEANCGNALYSTPLPAKSAFIMGNEGIGISFDKRAYPDIHCLAIPHFGHMESLNVSIAASIVMYEYIRQRAREVE